MSGGVVGIVPMLRNGEVGSNEGSEQWVHPLFLAAAIRLAPSNTATHSQRGSRSSSGERGTSHAHAKCSRGIGATNLGETNTRARTEN